MKVLPLLVTAAAGALVWAAASPLHLFARLWTVVLLVPFPLLMVLQAKLIRELGTLPRRAAYLSSIASLWSLLLLTLLVAWLSGLTAADLGLITGPPLNLFAWTAALTAAGIAILFLFRWFGVREADVLRDLLPVSTPERRLFVGVSVTAGVCEEIIFRGFLLFAVTTATGSATAGVLLSSAAFGVVHAYQQPTGALRVAILGAVLSLPLVAGHSILPSIAAHTVIDLLSGLWLARHLLR